MTKYKYIEMAESLKIAKDKLEAYRKLDMAAKKAAYTAQVTALGGKRVNVGRQDAYINPFGADDKLWYLTRILALPGDTIKEGEESEAALITTLLAATSGATGKRALTSLPTTANAIIVPAKKIRFAKVLYTDIKGNSKAATSRVTGLPYHYTETSTVSCSYGSLATAADNEQVARAALLTALKGENKRIGFKPQNV